MNVLILQHGELGPPGVLGDWCAARGLDTQVHRAGQPLPELNGQAFIASLGSGNNPDTDEPEVAAERAYLAQAIAKDIPVLGLCFGGQMLAAVLGGEIGRSPPPVAGDAYRAADAGKPLPAALEAALDALEADAVLRDALGPQIVDTFLAVKRFEVERHRAWVSDWEIDEYLHHL